MTMPSVIDNARLDRWDADELASRYRAEFGIDISALLTDDVVTLHRDSRSGVWMFAGCRPGDGDFYATLAKRDWYYLENKWEFDQALSSLQRQPADVSVLEIGCGHGAFLKRCRDAGLTNVRGTEFSREAINHCVSAGLKVCDTELDRLHQAGHRFDFVFAFQVLEHVPDPAAFLQSAAALLADGGKLVLATPNRESFFRRFRWPLLDLPPHHMSRWDADSYRQCAQMIGAELATIRYEPLAKHHHRVYASSFTQQYPRKSIRRRLTKWVARGLVACHPNKSRIPGHTILATLAA